MFLNFPFTKQLKGSSQLSHRFSSLRNLPHVHDNFTFTLYMAVLESCVLSHGDVNLKYSQYVHYLQIYNVWQ